jgi:hypothetical protein
MQHLHSTIYTIAERAESDVVTIYRIGDSDKTEAVTESDDLYAGFPIQVEVTSRGNAAKTRHSVPIIGLGATLKQRFSRMNLISLAKVATVAAVVFVAITLLLNSPTARGVSLQSIYKAVETVKNVHISKLVPGKREPIQEKWVSQTLAIYLTKTGNKFDLIDIYHRVGKSKMADGHETKTFPLTPASIATFERKIMSISQELMLFDDPSNIPANAIWSRVAGDSSRTNGQNLELYDLMWIEEDYSSPRVFWRWRVSVDPKTDLPHKVELYKRSSDDGEYSRETVIVLEYPSASEIQTAMKDAGF